LISSTNTCLRASPSIFFPIQRSRRETEGDIGVLPHPAVVLGIHHGNRTEFEFEFEFSLVSRLEDEWNHRSNGTAEES
jgi:hypothetical protein